MRNSRGMSMIEVVIWISVLVMVLAALTESVRYFNRTGKYTIEQASAVSSGQRGIDRAVRAIREAAYSSQGAFPVVSIGANSFVFYADIDQDPLIEKVRYFLQGSSLMQGITDAVGDPPGYTGAESVSVLSDFVRNLAENTPIFRYYNGNGAEITNYSLWADVRYVNANLIIDVDTNRMPNHVELESSAALRNLTGQ